MPDDPPRPVSERVQLARLAEQEIARTDWVRPTGGADARWATADGERTIRGVIAAEDGRGQIEVALHLDAVWPPDPFARVAEEIRGRLRHAAGRAGLGARLGAVPITFEDVVTPADQAAP